MQQKPYPVEFAFRGEPVGFFIGKVLPCGDCEQEYEAYRGPGHYKLGPELSGWRLGQMFLRQWHGNSDL